MKKFDFPLDSILRYRRHRLDEAQRNLAAARGVVQVLLARIHRLDRDIRASRQLALGERLGPIDVGRAKQHERHRLGLSSLMLSVQRELHKARETESFFRASWVRAEKEVKVLDKLREKRVDAWRLEMQRIDQKTTDEIASVATCRDLRTQQDQTHTPSRLFGDPSHVQG